jgi:hypothetical protein
LNNRYTILSIVQQQYSNWKEARISHHLTKEDRYGAFKLVLKITLIVELRFYIPYTLCFIWDLLTLLSMFFPEWRAT